MKYVLLLCFSILAYGLLAQCTGNLGENIFEDGDFGSGQANILQQNPNIAPGYGYTTFPPPQDGNYTITNNTSSWGSFASNWENIQDNSPDPNGYMMVVNASYDPGLFYEQEVSGLCDNTEFEFSADVYNLILGTQGVIIPNVTFLIDGVVQFETGDVLGGLWNTYGFTFTTEPGQTSVTLALQNNAPGGSGNDLAIDNITFRACGPKAQILPETIANICEDGDPITIDVTIDGDQYDTPAVQWQQSFDEGITWENIDGENENQYTHTNLQAGFYYYRYLLANGDENLTNKKCRVNSNIKIIRVEPKFYNITDTICEGSILTVGESTYSQTGIYTDSLLSSIGCDSIVIIDLTIIPDAGIQPTFIITDPTCDYLDDGSILIENIENGSLPYDLIINEVESDDYANDNLQDGMFSYTILDKYGCRFDTVINIIDPPTVTLDLGGDLVVELGESVLITPIVSEPAANFSLQPAGEFTCDDNCESISWTPTESTQVLLVAFSEANGCIVRDSINITLVKSRKIFFPNAFSPNGDNVNDAFVISGAIPNVKVIQLFTIHDRWGNQLYKNENFLPNDANQSWNGLANGAVVYPGVYTYKAEVVFLDGEVVNYLGTITLVR